MDGQTEYKRLAGKTVAFLVANGFSEGEMTEPQRALAAEGATVRIVSPEIGLVNGWHEGTWGHNFYVDTKIGDALPSHFDALLVPGGERSMTTLGNNAHARRILKGMVESGKPVGILSQAPKLLIGAGVASARTLTGDPALREALEASGAVWGEGQAVTDGKLISTAGGEDLPAFIETFLATLDTGAVPAREAA